MTARRTSVTFAPDVVVQVVGADALILKLEDESVFSLNDTGARIAQLIAGGHDLETVVSTLAGEYDVEPVEVASHVERLVETLVARGLLVVRTNGAEG